MQRGMFVLLDSDVDEEELEFVSKKLKKLHRKMEEKRERLKRSSVSPAPTPSPPESDTASTSSVVSTTQTESLPASSQQRKRKRKSDEGEEGPASGEKSTERDQQRSIVDGCVVSLRSSVAETENSKNINGDHRVPVNGEVVTASSCSKSGKLSMWGKPTKSTRVYSGRKESPGVAVCLTTCKSCFSYSLPVLSDKDLAEMTKYVALDCEFVGVGPNNKSALGRCSIVDHRGVILYDRFVTPEEPVTDYRTRWSGLRPRNLKYGIPFVVAQEQIAKVIKDKVVVGHAVHNDFKVMGVPHPVHCIRDTASCQLLKEMANLTGNACALRKLTQALLGRTIQKNEHCSVTDARACMDLFRLVRISWEPMMQAKFERRKARHTPGDTPGHPELKSFLDDQYWPANMFADSY